MTKRIYILILLWEKKKKLNETLPSSPGCPSDEMEMEMEMEGGERGKDNGEVAPRTVSDYQDPHYWLVGSLLFSLFFN